MTERELFLDALEREGPAARAAFLDAACAGQPALRQRVEELLRSHAEADTFLDVPAMEQVAAADQSLAFLGPSCDPGALGRLDHYEVLEVVGRGGTGVVLKARDTKLQRVVAIKVLAPRLAASSAARRRFVREAQAAARSESPRRDSAVPGSQATPRSRRILLVAACLVGLLLALVALAAWGKLWPDDKPGDATQQENPVPVASLELRREDSPPALLTLAGVGDPAQAPPELAAVLGDGRFLFPRIGTTSWMNQSPDGKLLAVPLDEAVVLFDGSTGTYLRTLKGPGGRVGWVTFSRDSQFRAASTWLEEAGGAVRVWGLAADRVPFTNPQPGPTVSCAVAFSQ